MEASDSEQPIRRRKIFEDTSHSLPQNLSAVGSTQHLRLAAAAPSQIPKETPRMGRMGPHVTQRARGSFGPYHTERSERF